MTEFVRAKAEHAATLLKFVRAYYEFDGIAFDRDSVARGITELIANPSLAEAWLIQDGSELVGHFVLAFGFDLEFGGRQATLTELYLEPHARGRGLGSATLRFAEERLRELGIRTLELQAEHDNTDALRFYERAGFVRETRIPLTKRW